MQRMPVCGVLFVVACSGGATSSPARGVAGPPAGSGVAVAPVEAPAFDTAAPPALKLPTNFRPEGYVARLVVDPARPTFTGSIAIRGDLDRKSAVIWLHGKQLHVRAASATRDKLSVPLVVTPRVEDLLELCPATPLPAGHYELALDYDGNIQPLGTSAGAFVSKYGEETYLTTQFEATSARLVFPCVDEPGSKVPWQLTLDVPKNQVAVSNTPVAREVPLDADHVRVAFAATRPLPTYLIAFGVGPYDVVDAGHAASGTPLRLIVPHGQAKRATYAAAELPKIIDALAAWTGVPFPYAKLDVVARDAGGAMENAGLIMMDSPYVLQDAAVPSAVARHDMISVIGHESAHQWFGDLVTAAWWDDIWLNEAFATFMEDKVEDALEPAWHDDDYQLRRRYGAFASDALASVRQIRQPITNEGDIHNAFDSITYSKGGTVIAMFEAGLGVEAFQRGIHAYLLAHADRSATLADLLAAIDGASGKPPIARAFTSFTNQPGAPALEATVACAADKPAHATLAQHRYVPVSTAAAAKEQQWRFPICVAYETTAHARAEVCGAMEEATLDLELPGAACPGWILPDAGEHAYARTLLTPEQAAALRDHAWASLTSRERRAVFDSVRTRVGNGQAPVALLMSFVPKLLGGDRFTIAAALGDPYLLGSANGLVGFSTFVPPSLLDAARKRTRAQIAPLVRRLGLLARPTDSLDDQAARQDVVAAGGWAGDPDLAKQAVAQSAHYHDLAPDPRLAVATLAVTASPAFAARLRTDAFAETDPNLRQQLFGVLGAIRGPARLRAMLDSVGLDPRIRARDLTELLTASSDEPERAVVEAWLRAHWDAVQKAIPTLGSEDFPPLLAFIGMFSRACDASRRDELAADMTKRFGSLPSGTRPTQQAIEALDDCIARRKLIEPSLRAWLTGR